MLYIQLYTYTYTCGNIVNTIMTNEHTSLEKYASHFIQKGCEKVMCERWVGDWTDCNILTPNSSVFSGTTFSFCWAAQSGVLRAHSLLLVAGYLYSILSRTNWHQLTQLHVPSGYIIVWHPPASCERRICTQFKPSTVKVTPWIVDRMHLFLDWLLGRRSMLHIYIYRPK